MKIGQIKLMPDPVEGGTPIDKDDIPVKFDSFTDPVKVEIKPDVSPVVTPEPAPPATPKVEPTVTTPEIKVEPKVESKPGLLPVEPPSEPEFKPTVLPKVEPAVTPPVVDILDGLTDFEKTLLTKKASNEVREYVASTLKKSRETIKTLTAEVTEFKNKGTNDKLPQNYSEHPDAYIFHPKYKETSGIISNVQTEMNYYTQQLDAIEKGEKWRDIEVIDGQYKLGPEQEPTTKAKIEIQNYLMRGNMMLSEKTKELNEIKSTHSNSHKQYMSHFKGLEDRYLPDFADETKIEKVDKDRIDNIRKLLGAQGQANNPLTSTVAKLYAMLSKYGEYITVNQAKFAALNKVPAKIETGPTSDDLGRGTRPASNGNLVPKSGDNDTPVRFDAFEKYKRE